MSLEKLEIIPKLAKLPIEFGEIGDWRNWRLFSNSSIFCLSLANLEIISKLTEFLIEFEYK